ncbi:MAG: BatA domain-containing protein, partial [Pseudomonadota bacterium]
MSVGPFVLGAPLALAALVALPILWFILRATPPAPKNVELPSLRLLEGVEPREETPDRTPWWVLLLRVLAVVAAVLGLAQPVYAPAGPPEAAETGPLLVVVDDGWASAARWSDLQNAADAAIDAAGRDTPVHLLFTAPKDRSLDPGERYGQQEARRILDAAAPTSWAVDRLEALARLDAAALNPSRVLYASHGLTEGIDGDFLAKLAALGTLDVYVAAPRGALAITSLSSDGNGVGVTLARTNTTDAQEVPVSALTLDGAALSTAR